MNHEKATVYACAQAQLLPGADAFVASRHVWSETAVYSSLSGKVHEEVLATF